MRSQAHAPTQCKLMFLLQGQKVSKFVYYGQNSLPSTPTLEVRGKEKFSKEDGLPKKGGEKSLYQRDSVSKGSSTIILNVVALGSVIAEALGSSFKGLRHSINARATWLPRTLTKNWTMLMMMVIRTGLRTTMNHLSRASHPLRKAD